MPDGLREIEIVPPRGHVETHDDSDGDNESDDHGVEEPKMPDGLVSWSEDYETAGSSGSEAESDVEQLAPAPVADEPDAYRTRSGRAVRPPVRYGCP